MQIPLLFSGTLKENLLLGNPSATDEQIAQASKIAGVDQIAAALPNGFETVLTERGQQLSGGQRQAICIARAFIGDPKIIIMDEPSSAMDSASEKQLLADLIKAVKDKTFILITHRGTLLDAVDRVIILDSGRIVTDGPKQEVLDAAKKAAIKS
jgi:ATP-binding cassette subfamily C protein LapB